MLDEPANHLPAANRTAPPVGNASLPAPLRALSNRLTGGTPANGAEAPCARSLDGPLGDVRDRSLSATESR
nr:putative prdm16 protein [Burkholderia pseudomallei]